MMVQEGCSVKKRIVVCLSVGDRGAGRSAEEREERGKRKEEKEDKTSPVSHVSVRVRLERTGLYSQHRS